MKKEISYRNEHIIDQKVKAAKSLARTKKGIRSGEYPESLSLPLDVQFELTSQCNLQCKHCYNGSSASNTSRMTFEDWEDVINNIVINGGIFQAIFTGGEPLLFGKKLIKLMEILSRDGTGLSIITNGYLVDEGWVDCLKNFKFYCVQVSIDHLLPEEHDEFRGKAGSWEKAVRAAFLFANAGLPVRISHCLTPNSIKYLEKFAEFSYELGAASLICGELMLSGRSYKYKDDILMNDYELEETYKLISVLRQRYTDKMEILAPTPISIAMQSKAKRPNTGIIIRPDGNVRLDCTMPFVIGNVLKQPFSEIWRNKSSEAWRHPLVTTYISQQREDGSTPSHINYVMPDMFI